MGRSFGAFELALSSGFDHMSFGDMRLGNLRVSGKGESAVYHVTAKPSLVLALNDRFSLKSGLIFGLASRQSEYEVLSVGFKESGQNLSVIWGLQLGTSFTMSDHHQLFANYRLLGTPSADEFEGFISHAIEGGFRLTFNRTWLSCNSLSSWLYTNGYLRFIKACGTTLRLCNASSGETQAKNIRF